MSIARVSIACALMIQMLASIAQANTLNVFTNAREIADQISLRRTQLRRKDCLSRRLLRSDEALALLGTGAFVKSLNIMQFDNGDIFGEAFYATIHSYPASSCIEYNEYYDTCNDWIPSTEVDTVYAGRIEFYCKAK